MFIGQDIVDVHKPSLSVGFGILEQNLLCISNKFAATD